MHKTLLAVFISATMIGGANFAEAAEATVTATAKLNVVANPALTLTAESMPDMPAGNTPAGTVLAKFDLVNTGTVASDVMIIFPTGNAKSCSAGSVCLVSSDGENAITLTPSDETLTTWNSTMANGLKSKTPLQPNASEVISLVSKGQQSLVPGQYTLTAQAGIVSQ
ncbi:TPA: hypothetical protein ACWV6L_004391 [Salmonella enterica subsp. enterica serovar Muenchen]|uniref:hypothetical protein n=1 Tax=Salmonella TaxID=590 RepID=UPI000B50EFCA|nr:MULTISPECIES: hypothetical protein [Salmonella]EAY2125678.1 hypothetical protein [Salmonella enterica]EDS5478606.1 hypothetical protein [Salmonella enterica subsp. enterica]EDZ5420678.1 hypothetical protein [Salmonella enterica subsp. enterica serovar Muenchen]EHC6923148.1 hypothetical protein [Salmonella enterica subsp. enterica serovar Chester]ASD99247.1 hypothetical protein LFZ35_24930 [Salmonella enterica subsp. enterica serovar Onderstepoort str. SA20060086]